ncbi:MAG TPA: hypothetical protein VFA47_01965 [Candidatus Manganitrophaceae bacterium]|nr:hypothetical protein [Candidatus Manganitrophaceae bacterium]
MKNFRDHFHRTATVFLIAVFLSSGGCAGRQKMENVEKVDRLSQVTAEHEGPTASYGHPFRIIAFVVHPVGVALDYVVVRPIYFIASLAPGLFGYTAEDRTEREKARSPY